MSASQPVPRLTELSHGAGCACKIGAAELAPILESLPEQRDPNLLVGSATRDDAAVFRVSEELAIVQTADFFTPIVDDPFDFGRIAAANALSDIYAMGATPILAINLVAYSIGKLGVGILQRILAGGAAIAGEAGVAIGGGHSIDDPEPKYGMAVIGVVHPDEVLTNAAAVPGDEIFLTKPIGGGLITTANTRGIAPAGAIARATEVMCELNESAARLARKAQATAVTDVTGFGLLGHLHEMCSAARVGAEIIAESVPAIESALALAAGGRSVADGSQRNYEYVSSFVDWHDVDDAWRVLLTDAMTSGGLLLTVPSRHASAAPGTRIGRVINARRGQIMVR